MKMTLCPYCMKETAEEICPHCGKPVAYGGEPAHLQAGFVLNGTHPYILGAALGQGGFGITYIALDMVTNQRVAIKEYYPTYCAVRSDARTVTFYRGQEEVYNKGRDRFLDEARVLKSLSDIKSIVNVRDFFEANNTAYLVMEFLEGDSLKAHAQKHGKFPAQEFLRKLRPLMEDIDQMHQRGVVHRDIAPDNIILTPDGQMKLIDFGAARSYVGDKSMTVVVKKGFAPIEQYMRHGSTAATDVYALAATIYYCTTGTVPPDSAERQYEEDMLKSPISLGAELSKEQERAILKALEVQPKKRTQSVAEFIKALEHAPKPEKPKPVKKAEKPKADPKKKPIWIIPAIAAALLCLIGTVWFIGRESSENTVQMQTAQTEPTQTAAAETEPVEVVPDDVINVMAETEYIIDGQDQTFWGQSVYARKEVVTVSFVYTLKDAPADAWDVSAAQDGSILAWMKEGDLTVASNGHIALNPNSSGMFSDFENLESVDFGKYLDTSLLENMNHMFAYCKNLQVLDVSGFDTSNVTKMDYLFEWCNNLQELDVSRFNTSNVTNMEHMFYDCNNLQKLDVSGFDTSKVTSMWVMFGDCSNLRELDVTGFDTSNVIDMCGMFSGCSNLQELDVTGFNTSKVTRMGIMFSGCSNLQELDVTGFDTSKVTDMGSMFSGCSNLQELDVTGFVTSKVTDMGNMFSGCSNLQELDVTGFDTSKVTDMSSMFYGCKKLQALDVSSFNTKKVEDMSSMFMSCSSLKNLNLNSFKYTSVKKIRSMFFGCTCMETLYMKGFDSSKYGVVDTTTMFQNCPAKIIK